MKLTEISEPSDRMKGRMELKAELERIFKLKPHLLVDPHNGKVTLWFDAPEGADADELQFTAALIKKKLPALFKQFRNTETTIGEVKVGDHPSQRGAHAITVTVFES